MECLICGLKEQDVRILNNGERISLECNRCGIFSITRTAAAMLEGNGQNFKLSAWIRNQQDSITDKPEINSNTLIQIVPTLPAYKISEKQSILLRTLGKTVEFDGKPLDIIPMFDFPLAWAANEDEFKYILRLLIEKKLLRRIDGPSDLTDSFVYKFEITAAGWSQLEDEPSMKKHINNNPQYDIFISHASEDKDAIARPIYNALVDKGISVWFDEAVLKMGDNLRRKIDEGLSKCKYGVVILSPDFFSKEWPQKELDGLMARETVVGKKAILPIWHKLDHDALLKFSPTLADKLAISSEKGIQVIVDKIIEALT